MYGEFEQVNGAVANTLQREVDELQAKLDRLALYFTSGNCVPVKRATIRADDFWRITGMQPMPPNA